jgi:hypothetical protein
MKQKSKLHSWMSAVVAGLTLAAGSSLCYGADDIIVGPSGTQSGVSGSAPDYEWQNMWGPAFSAISFDAANPPPSGDTTGSIYIQGNWTANQQDNYNIGSPGNWWGAVTFDGSQYTSIEMDLKFDTNSTIVPSSQAHLDVGFDQGYALKFVQTLSMDRSNLVSSPLADGAWHHVSIPVPSTISGATTSHSIGFYQWNPSALGTMNFWVANVQFLARVVPIAPPSVALQSSPVRGLIQFSDTHANATYDRSDVRTTTTTTALYSWVGKSKPVNYSWTVGSFAGPTNNDFNLSFVITPDPLAGQTYSDPDWSASEALYIQMDNNGGGAAATPGMIAVGIGVKTNQPNGNSQYNTNATVAFNNTNSFLVPYSKMIGTWRLTFNTDINITLTAPDGSSTNVNLPDFVATDFNGPVGVFLFSQPNQTYNYGQSVTLVDFRIYGASQLLDEDFTTGILDPNLQLMSQNYNSVTNPANQLWVGPDQKYWLNWSLPASFFSPIVGTDLTVGRTNWTDLAGTPVTGGTTQTIPVLAGQLPPSSTAFFAMIKRTNFTQLQILLPGQTNAPGTLLGYVGSPTPQSTSATTPITINAVDPTFHIINGVNDTIQITSSDANALIPNNFALANGTATISGSNGFQFVTQSPPDMTITATDTTNAGIPPVTSAPVTVGP